MLEEEPSIPCADYISESMELLIKMASDAKKENTDADQVVSEFNASFKLFIQLFDEFITKSPVDEDNRTFNLEDLKETNNNSDYIIRLLEEGVENEKIKPKEEDTLEKNENTDEKEK